MILATEVTDWIQAIAVVAGVVLAFLGLRTWAHQLRAQVEHDAALELMVSARALQSAIEGARIHWTVAADMASQTHFESGDRVRAVLREPRSRFTAASLRCRALWPSVTTAAEVLILRVLVRFVGACDEASSHPHALQTLPDSEKEVLGIGFAQLGEDSFGKAVEAAVLAIEAFAQPKLLTGKAPRWWWRLLGRAT